MKWSIFVCLLACLARFCEAGALRCPPGVTECTEDKKEVSDKNESSTSSHTGSTTECLAGSEWESNCHYCRCSDSGIAECLKSRSCADGVYEEPYLCKPNTTFLRECNKCLCLDNGMALCSMEFCSNKPQILSIEDIDKVETTANSEVTDIVVPSSEEYGRQNTIDNNHDVLKRSAICTPNEEFQSDCNSCKCDTEGRSYSCTHNECLEPDMDEEVEVFKENEGVDHVERHSVCRARSTFYVSCNTCRCNEIGTDYTCTNKPCPLPDDVELFHELKTATPYAKNESKAVVCEANRMFVKDCNTCWCNEDGTSYFCTRRVCVPLLPDEQPDLGGIPAEDLRVTKKKCRPDEVFELDCNMCRCNPDGTSYSCTRRACFEIEKKNVTLSRKVRAFTSEPTKTCQPGQEFRLDCNKCLCDNEGQDFSCTRIDCNALNNNQHATRRKRDTTANIETQCVAGSVFDRDCNVCRCTKDGNHAICTNKSCVQQNEVDHDRAPETGFRCTPGEQFKRECNDCTCSADGRSVFCTLRLCDRTPDI